MNIIGWMGELAGRRASITMENNAGQRQVKRFKVPKFKLVPRSRGFAAIAAVLMAVSSVIGLAAPTAFAAESFPDDVNRVKYNGSAICVGSTLRSDLYPVGAIAQQWNVAVNGRYPAIALTYKTTCSPYEQSMTVGVFNNPNYGACIAFTNTETFPSGESNISYWQHGLGIYLNVGIPGCVSTAQRRSHQIAAGIGYALGLRIMTTPGYASRIMCTCSTDTLRAPDSTSAYRVWQIYNGVYGW
jgi:hypothetical protein